jgi:hypothetical protein
MNWKGAWGDLGALLRRLVMQQGTYSVFAAAMGECCQKPHLFMRKYLGRTKGDACKKMRQFMKRAGFDVGDVVAYKERHGQDKSAEKKQAPGKKDRQGHRR